MTKLLKIENQKILVTGGAGFIGGALITWLLENTKSHIINVDKLGYASNLSRIDNTIKALNISNYRYKFILADLIDANKVMDIVNKNKPDIIFHLAAESHVDRSIDSPKNFVESNVIGTFNLLEASRIYWQKIHDSNKNIFRFVHISTDEVYGSLGIKGSFTEESSYDPRSPYSASKAASDHFVKAYYHTYGLPILITNCSNNYGPWQFPEKLIPVIISKALSNNFIPVYGDGLNIRDWIYVDDHINALITVLEKGTVGSNYCIGSSEEHTNMDIVKNICSFLDREQPSNQPYSHLIKTVKDRLGHDKRYAIDSSKIRYELGWRPKYKFQDSLEKTIRWYMRNQF